MAKEHSSTCRSGVALVVVLLIISVIAAVIFEFSHDSYLRFQLAENVCKSHQALHCAEAGLTMAVTLLERSDNFWADEEAVSILTGVTQVPIGDGSCTIFVVGEQGKIKINGLVSPKGEPVRPRVDQMLRLIDVLNSQYPQENPISYGVVPAIIDWIDPDEDVTVLPFIRGENTGVESDYYQSLEKPYHSKNGPFEVLGELMLVKGMTREIFQGASGARGGGPTLGMGQFLTVYGDGRLNINHASTSVLQTFSDEIDQTLAEAIVRNRPYRSLRELSEIPGMTPEILTTIQEIATVRVEEAYYTVTAKGIAGRCVRMIRVVVGRDLATGRFGPLVRWEM
jgi:general secretion pathway protein K